MSKPNRFTSAQQKRIFEVGRQVEEARLARRLSIRSAADLTVVPSARGKLTEFTWRRIEKGYVSTGLGNIVYRPTGTTLAAIAEVVDLDAEELCKKVGVEAPPPRLRRSTDVEVMEIRKELERLIQRLSQLERRDR